MAKYNDKQCKQIMTILVNSAYRKIPPTIAKKYITDISSTYPIHNYDRYVNITAKYLSGKGEYGFAFPANWAKAFLQVTDNNENVIHALRDQQRLYLEKDGRNNGKLKKLLDSLQP